MRKKIIVFLMFLWLIAFARIFIPEAKEEGLDIVTAFSNEKFMYTDSILKAEGSIEGELNNTEKNNITDEIMKKLEAKVVTGNRDDSIYTVYGYCGKIEEYVVFGSTKTNINVAITYDEQNNLTRVYMATPIISTEY